MSQALAFVLGAAVVGVITLAREWLGEQRRWAREDAAQARVVRSARRLVGDELDTIGNHLAMMLRHDRWPVPDVADRGRFLAQAEWEENKRLLAETLDDDNTWDLLGSFHYSVGQLRVRALSSQSHVCLDAKESENLKLMEDQARVLKAVVENKVPLPDDWRAQLQAVRNAGKEADAAQPSGG